MAVPEEYMDIDQSYIPEDEIKLDEEPEEEITEELSPLHRYLGKGNIVAELGDKTPTAKITELFDDAKSSMAKWLVKYKRALNLAKLQPTINDVEVEKKDTPFENASMVMLPFITEAQLDFNARSAPELAWAKKIVKPKVYGKSSEEKSERSKRAADYSNIQFDELIENWRSEQDKMLFNLSASGTAYKHTYFDPEKQEVASDLLMADNVIFNHDYYTTFEKSKDRFIERSYTKNQVIGFIRGEQEWDMQESDLEDDKEEFEFIEAYTWIDLDDDGLKEPYFAVINKDSEKIVSLYPDYDNDTITQNDKSEIVSVNRIDCFTQYRYLPDPEGGPMGLGWGILLGPMFEHINTTARQLSDAGTLHITSSNSGIINKRMGSGRGNSARLGEIELRMGKLVTIETNGNGKLSDDILTFPFSGPSPVLFQLMDFLISSSRAMTNAAVNIQAQPNESAMMYLAKLDQGLKVPNSINMRVHDCLKSEIKKISLLNYRHHDSEKYNNALDSDIEASMEDDFNPKDMDISLVSDPMQGSLLERIQRAQSIVDEAKDPNKPTQIIDYRKAVIDKLEIMGVEDIESIIPEPQPEKPDPIQQMMVAQQMADLENTKRSNELRAQENEMKAGRLKLETQAQAMSAAEVMGKLGIQNDETQAKISKMYVESLKMQVDMGISLSDAMNNIVEIEDKFIGDDKAVAQLPQNNQSPA